MLCCTRLTCSALLCCIVLCSAVLCCTVLCCNVLCCIVLCCSVLCCTVLCCAVQCCAVLHCAVLCCVHCMCCVVGIMYTCDNNEYCTPTLVIQMSLNLGMFEMVSFVMLFNVSSWILILHQFEILVIGIMLIEHVRLHNCLLPVGRIPSNFLCSGEKRTVFWVKTGRR